MFQTIIRAFCTVVKSTTLTHTPPNYPHKMSETRAFKNARYDGRTKKRQWEERRTDKGEDLKPEPKKKVKLEENNADLKPQTNEVKESEKKPYDRIKRRKYVLLLGYSGADYFGMQRNPLTRTIEEDLVKALYKSEFIDESDYNQVQNMQFQRAARTDKGVSAARQIVSLKLKETVDIEKINQELPEVIRVFGCKRVTKGFNSKSQCDGRTYTYILPTVAFANQNEEVMQKDFRLSDEKFNRVSEILKMYEGTKNFHNFTSKKKPSDPSAKRYMKSFVIEKPFIRRDVEFAVLKVHGQSFMLHQIRKMVGLLLAIVRGLAPLETMDKALSTEKISIPRAPGLGLVLDFVHYERYNIRYGQDGMHETLSWEEVEDKINEFKEKYIYPNIINIEVEQESMLTWIHRKLSRHSYDEEETLSDEENDEGDDENEVCDNVADVKGTSSKPVSKQLDENTVELKDTIKQSI